MEVQSNEGSAGLPVAALKRQLCNKLLNYPATTPKASERMSCPR